VVVIAMGLGLCLCNKCNWSSMADDDKLGWLPS
jgi:hypothetical protein